MKPTPSGRESAPRTLRHAITRRPPNAEFSQREVRDYRPADEADREWTFRTANWRAVGLYGSHANRADRLQVALAMPFASWQARCANVLPGDQVVFEWGGQIVLYDRPKNQVSFIAFGRGPAVVLDDPPPLEPIPASNAPRPLSKPERTGSTADRDDIWQDGPDVQ